MRTLARKRYVMWGASWWVGVALSPENYAAVVLQLELAE